MNVHTLAMNFKHANLECSISIVFACFRQVSSKSDSILGVAFLESKPDFTVNTVFYWFANFVGTLLFNTFRVVKCDLFRLLSRSLYFHMND